MNDVLLLSGSVGAVTVGLASCVALARRGLPTTYVRDLLHVGAGVWVLSWPYWGGPAVPTALVGAVFAITAAVPLAARRLRFAALLRNSVASGDERWGGLTAYTFAAFALTAVGLAGDPVPAGAAFWALSLGDGLGGAFGRRFGRHMYVFPWGKRKSLEGSLTVLLASTVGALAAAAWLGAPLSIPRALLAGAAAALAEGAAPRASDNLLVPAAVWAVLSLG